MRLAQHIHLNKRANLKQEEQQNKQTNTQEKRHMSEINILLKKLQILLGERMMI